MTQRAFDALGRVTGVRSATGTAAERVEYTGYTSNGQQSHVIDGNGNRTDYQYDGHDRLRRVHYPSTGKGLGTASGIDYEEYGYDPRGLVTSRRLRDGQVIGFDHDALGRVVLKRMPRPMRDVAYRYDLTGNLLGAHYDHAQGHDAVMLTYDALGRKIGERVRMAHSDRTTGSGYNAAGDRVWVSHPEHTWFGYQYDKLGRMVSGQWTGPSLGTVQYLAIGYNEEGRRSTITRGSSGADYGYDALGRLSRQDLVFRQGGLDTGSYSYVHRYELAHNPASQIASRSVPNAAYAPLAKPNLSRSYTTDGLNRYTQSGPYQLGYDHRGNLTSDSTDQYAYDYDNLLSGVPSREVQIIYDPLGRLWRLATPSRVSEFLYNGSELAVEYDQSGAVRRRYVWGAGVDEPLIEDEGGAMNCTGTRFLQTDERGSIVAQADCWGNRTAVNRYDEHGIPHADNVGRFQYTGQMWLPEAGLYYYKARMYSPTLGRFMQTDPIGYAAGLNWYDYVNGDPVNLTDPSGMCPVGTVAVTRTGSRIHECLPKVAEDAGGGGASGSAGGRWVKTGGGPTPYDGDSWVVTGSRWTFVPGGIGVQTALNAGQAPQSVVSDVLNHDIGEDIVIIANKVPKPVQNFISNYAINYDCAFISRSNCSTSDYITVAGVLLTGSIGANTAVEGASKGFAKYGIGRAGQIRFYQNRLIFRLDVNKPITHLNVEGNLFGVKFNFHLPRF